MKNSWMEPKDQSRIYDIVTRAKGYNDQAINLAESMAKRIGSSAKAERRAHAAEDENYHRMASVFYRRALELKAEGSEPFPPLFVYV